jgi:hypothetical protein
LFRSAAIAVVGAAFEIALLFPGDVPNWGILPGVNTLAGFEDVVDLIDGGRLESDVVCKKRFGVSDSESDTKPKELEEGEAG